MSHYILLSTFDPKGSKNLGDHLLTASVEKLIKKLKPKSTITTYFREDNLTDKLDALNKADAVILPGFAVRKNSYPDTYRLVDDLSKLKTPIIPIGCGTKFTLPDSNKKIDAQSLEFLRFLSKDRPIPCRELITWQVLKNYNIPVAISGDLGMFDADLIGKDMNIPKNVKQLIFTTPHNPYYLNQCKSVMAMVGKLFPKTEKILSFQSELGHGNHPHEYELERYAKEIGFNVWQPDFNEGDVDPLKVYKGSDFHIGYRCHGHLYFLRTRKPSILISEDSRGVGFSEILGTPVFPAYNPCSMLDNRYIRRALHILNKKGMAETVNVNSKLADDIQQFLTEELASGFLRLQGIAQRIDHLYETGMKPTIESLP